MATVNVPSVQDIRASFPTKPSSYPVSLTPTSSQVKKLRKTLMTNLKKIPCLLPGAKTTGWIWLLLTPTEWTDRLIVQRGVLVPDPIAIALLPGIPDSPNPGLFTINDGWTDKQISKEVALYAQKLYHYQFKCNLKQTCLLDLSSAIPSSLITDLQDDEGDLLNPSCDALLKYMEKTYDRLRPQDISKAMATFNTPFDDTTTLNEYYKRQQSCQTLLKKTAEPIFRYLHSYQDKRGHNRLHRPPYCRNAIPQDNTGCNYSQLSNRPPS